MEDLQETYEENPEFWMSSGYGCFLAIRELHTVTAHRVHVFMTLRAEVVGELRKSEHFSKWTRDLFQIGWWDEDLLRVFDSRAARLKARNLLGASLQGMPPLVRFLGPSFLSERDKRAVIRVPRAERVGRRVFLPFDQYMLRHTLRRPRDLIVLGNKIIESRRMAPTDGRDEVQLVREAVDHAASEVIAEGYLAEVAERWPWASRPGGSIKEFFSRHIRKNVLSLREAAAIEHEYARELMLLKGEVRPFRELGRLGIVGWPVQNAHSQRGEIQHFGMRRILFLLGLAFAVASVVAPAVWAGNPHFVGGITVTRDGNTLTVSGKEAGLGNEDQVHIVVTVSAECINPGGHHPKAGNKESFSAEGDFPVQNGKAEFTLSVTATFQPDCTPPMSLVFSDVTVCDATHNLCKSFPGTF